MTDVPPGGLPPPPAGPSGYPPPFSGPSGYPPPSWDPGGYPPPSLGSPYPGYQQAGYGWSAGSAQPQFAGFWLRFAASLLDGLILLVPNLILFFAIVDIDVGSSSSNAGFGVGGSGFDTGGAIVATVLGSAISLVYGGLLEGSRSGATVGKRACSIRVVDAATLQPGIGIGRGFGRNGAKLLFQLPQQVFFPLAILSLLDHLWMLWDPKKQTWHDKLAKTCVVKA